MKREPIEDRLAGVLPLEALLPQSGCRLMLAEKYLRPGESNADQVFERIAHALARDPLQAEHFAEELRAACDLVRHYSPPSCCARYARMSSSDGSAACASSPYDAAPSAAAGATPASRIARMRSACVVFSSATLSHTV